MGRVPSCSNGKGVLGGRRLGGAVAGKLCPFLLTASWWLVQEQRRVGEEAPSLPMPPPPPKKTQLPGRVRLILVTSVFQSPERRVKPGTELTQTETDKRSLWDRAQVA